MIESPVLDALKDFIRKQFEAEFHERTDGGSVVA